MHRSKFTLGFVEWAARLARDGLIDVSYKCDFAILAFVQERGSAL